MYHHTITCPTIKSVVVIDHKKETFSGIGDFVGEHHTYACSKQNECHLRETIECIVKKKEILQSR